MDKCFFFRALYEVSSESSDNEAECGDARGKAATRSALPPAATNNNGGVGSDAGRGAKRAREEDCSAPTRPEPPKRRREEQKPVPFYCLDNFNVPNKTPNLLAARSAWSSPSSPSPQPRSRSVSPRPVSPLRSKKKEKKKKKNAMSMKAVPTCVKQMKPATPSRKLPWLNSKPSTIKTFYSAGVTKNRANPSSAKAKAKANAKAKARPLSETHRLLLRGLVLYYYPSPVYSAVRHFQMEKALERGAVQAENFSLSVTHLIVDSRCSLQEALDHLRLQELPSGIHVVNEYYAPECIEFGYRLNEKQTRFRVRGHVVAASPPDETERKGQVITNNKRTQDVDGDKLRDERPPPEESHNKSSSDALVLQKNLASCHAASSRSPSASASPPPERPNPEPAASSNAHDNPAWQAAFRCMQAHPLSSAPSANHATIAILEQMVAYYERTDDTFRQLSYQRAITALRRSPVAITTKAAALALPGVGESLADTITEIATTQSLRRLETAASDPMDAARQLFVGVYGAGPRQAQAWIARGFRTPDDLQRSGELTRTQRIGVERHADFNSRIARDEVCHHGELVQETSRLLDSSMTVEIGGSYRRGKETSGDIDFLIIGPDGMPRKALQCFVFDKLVPALFKKGYLKCALADGGSASHELDDEEEAVSPRTRPAAPGPRHAKEKELGSLSKWHGAAALPDAQGCEVWRRVDFLVVPAEEEGAALLYFTGSALFNRSMRLLARKKGMRLNEKGLWARPASGSGKGVGKDLEMLDGTLLEARNERAIFEILGVPWREAHDRNC